MIYLITDSGVKSARTFKQLNDRYHVLLEPDECISVGADFVAKITNKDMEFLQDKAKVSNIMFSNFFRKDNSGKLLTIVNIILSVVILFAK